jgi:hypothetical protein
MYERFDFVKCYCIPLYLLDCPMDRSHHLKLFHSYRKGNKKKVDGAKHKHYVCSELAIAVTVVCTDSRQNILQV